MLPIANKLDGLWQLPSSSVQAAGSKWIRQGYDKMGQEVAGKVQKLHILQRRLNTLTREGKDPRKVESADAEAKNAMMDLWVPDPINA